LALAKVARIAAWVFLLLGYIPAAKAQILSGYIGGGTATDSSVGPINTLGGGTIYQAPRMGGFFETYGGDFIFFHGLGIGAEESKRRDLGAYAGLQYRALFFDANVVYRPWTLKKRRFQPEFQAGYGRADLDLYVTPQICRTLPQGCGASNVAIASVSDGEFHVAAGARVYLYRGAFVRPQFDLRRVPNDFSTYFGSSWIPEYSVAVGYTFNLRKWVGWGEEIPSRVGKHLPLP
jgi:hypothetical protein